MDQIAVYYKQLVDLLTLKQCIKLMGGSMLYRHKAIKAKKVSNHKEVHRLANLIIELTDHK